MLLCVSESYKCFNQPERERELETGGMKNRHKNGMNAKSTEKKNV